MHLPPLSLYVHIPWCVRKCPYCDFNSHAATGELPEQAYIRCLINDLRHCQPLAEGRKLHSIFFGGGTPSLFTAKGIEQILNSVESLIGFNQDIEITLEANPGSFEQERFKDYRLAGVNRLSIGVQSFAPQQLQNLGRIHSETEASLAIHNAREVGFDNINVDLMHGLPTQTIDQALSDLQRAIEFNPSHLSWYQLTIEKNTEFYTSPPLLPDTDALVEIETAGFELLDRAGFQRYEISAFCSNDKPAKHNLNYWQFGDYFGIGAGAHGKVTDVSRGQILRSQMTRLPEHYLHQPSRELQWKNVAEARLPFEFMMNGLRLTAGVPIKYFEQRTGLKLTMIEDRIKTLKQKGLLIENDDHLKTTALGQRFLNDILLAFL